MVSYGWYQLHICPLKSTSLTKTTILETPPSLPWSLMVICIISSILFNFMFYSYQIIFFVVFSVLSIQFGHNMMYVIRHLFPCHDLYEIRSAFNWYALHRSPHSFMLQFKLFFTEQPFEIKYLYFLSRKWKRRSTFSMIYKRWFLC